MQSEGALRQAVEQQLDLILKIEEERKLLKKENKVLKEEHQKMAQIIKKYQNKGQHDFAVQTENITSQIQTQEKVQTQTTIITANQSTQVDLEHFPSQSTSKLLAAQQLLKRTSINPSISCQKCQQNKNRQNTQQSNINQKSSNKEVSSEILKMAKQISALKRQLLQSQKSQKTLLKQLKQTKRCLDVKSEALQKSRKDFNQLSLVFNTDKYKSIKTMGQQLTKTKTKLAILQQQKQYTINMRNTLEQITTQYEQYREDRESRIESLISELKYKDSLCEDLSREMESLRLETSRI